MGTELTIASAVSLAVKIAFAMAFVWFVLWIRRRTPVVRQRPGGTDVRRWFRFRMSGLLVAITVAAVVALLLRESRRTFLEGTWHGYQPQFANCGLVVHYDRLTLFENGQAKTFTMKFPMKRHAQEIDLYGPDGLQLGMYGDGDRQIQLQLAEPGEPRPPTAGQSVGGKSRFYVFERDEDE